MALTKISGDVIQSGIDINIGIVTATQIDGNINGNVNSTGVSTFSTLQVGASVNISSGVVTATTFSGSLSGNATGLSGTPNITVGTIGATSLNASGVVTATTFSGNLTGNVTGNATGLSGTPNITVGAITAESATITGSVSVAGTVTYEDTTNVDSIGIITARSGIRVNDGGVVLIGSGTSTGTASQPLQVTGGAYVSGNVGFKTSNPKMELQISQSGGFQTYGGTGEIALRYNMYFDGTNDRYIQSSNKAGSFIIDQNGKFRFLSTNTSSTSSDSIISLTEVMSILSNGNIGVNQTTPVARFHLEGNGSTYAAPDNSNTQTIYNYNSNSSSTSAHSILALRTTGSGGGNPFVSLDINGIGGWSCGIDNADSDKFKISNSWANIATNNRFSITTDGIITTPAQPAFAAYDNSGTTRTSGTVIWNVKLFDRQNNYNTSNGRFTAPVSGVYLFRTDFRSSSTSGSPIIDIVTSNGYRTRHEETAGIVNVYHQSLCMVCYMNANDFAYVEVGGGSIRMDTNQIDNFAGYLVG